MQEKSYKRYLLSLLMVLLAFNQLDRFALGIVLQDIKRDLNLSDTELGFVTGIAFAFFYSVFGIPIARWADRGNRVTIIAVTAAIWSAAVALCGVAGNFVQLMWLRIATAVGESGCMPPAHSLIADEFSREHRPRAMALFMLGPPLALTIGYFAAGWLNEFFGWRITFAILGAPGIALALVAYLTLREPRRLSAFGLARSVEKSQSLRAVAESLWRNAAYRHLVLCFSVWFFFAYGILQWLPAFFIRSHGLGTGVLGSWFALTWGVIGGAGVYVGGEMAARHAAGNERLQLVGCAIAFCAFAILMATAFLVSSYLWAFGALMLAAFGGNLALGPIFATTQTLVPANMRAMSIAIVYLFANLIGMGLGPLVVGAMSDSLRPYAGEESLRYSLLIMCPGYIWAAWHLWRAARAIDAVIGPIQRNVPATDTRI